MQFEINSRLVELMFIVFIFIQDKIRFPVEKEYSNLESKNCFWLKSFFGLFFSYDVFFCSFQLHSSCKAIIRLRIII